MEIHKLITCMSASGYIAMIYFASMEDFKLNRVSVDYFLSDGSLLPEYNKQIDYVVNKVKNYCDVNNLTLWSF